MNEFLSKRGRTYVKDMSPLMLAHFSTQNERYDPVTRPDGYINLGTAETYLINDEVADLLYNIQNRMKIIPEHFHYDYFYGSLEFRKAISSHWQNLIFGVSSETKITPDNIVVGSGCSLVLEMLATMLADPGDVFLVPAPFYSGFKDDFTERAKVSLIPVSCGADLTRFELQKEFDKQIKKNRNVVGVLYSSPNNPTGVIYSKKSIKNLIDFSMENDLEIISDEIYAETVHNSQVSWVSTLNLVPDNYLHRVHVTSSFAKDFALSGLRTGFAISFNRELIKGMQNLAYYSGVSTHTQAILTELLNAPELPDLMQKNKEQLRAGYERIKKHLEHIDVNTLAADAGIFIFADFSNYMNDKSFAEENALWEHIFRDLKINITPGRVFENPEPGWFRICYAHKPVVIDEVCKRLITRLKK